MTRNHHLCLFLISVSANIAAGTGNAEQFSEYRQPCNFFGKYMTITFHVIIVPFHEILYPSTRGELAGHTIIYYAVVVSLCQ